MEQENRFVPFMSGGLYATWEPAEQFEHRIRSKHRNDSENEDGSKLSLRRRDLRTFLSIIGKYVAEAHYNTVIRHSTSLDFIYTRLREDYDIQQRGIHFLGLTDLQYDSSKTPLSFYNEFRNLVIGNLRKKNDRIEWNNTMLDSDEKLSASHEDLILLFVLHLIDPKLPSIVKTVYTHQMGKNKCLMDFKTDILIKVPKLLQEGTDRPNGETHQLCAIGRGRSRPFRGSPSYARSYDNSGRRPQRAQTRPNKYCRLCHLAGLPSYIVGSHMLGDDTCSQLSDSYRRAVAASAAPRVNAIEAEDNDVDDLGALYGFSTIQDDYDKAQHTGNVQQEQVSCNFTSDIEQQQHSCNFIRPVPSQILTLFTTNKQPVHIELDSNATANYISTSFAKRMKFNITPNSQVSVLADGFTKMKAVGEISEVFYRNDWSVIFKAMVVNSLSSDMIGGTVFLKDNDIVQNFQNNSIIVKNKFVVAPTNPASLMPTKPINHLLKFNSTRTLLPNQSITCKAPIYEGQLSVESWHLNSINTWPSPQIAEVKNGCIELVNDSSFPVVLGTEVKTLQIRDTSLINDSKLNVGRVAVVPKQNLDYTQDISYYTTPENKLFTEKIRSISVKYSDVFNQDLSSGYTGFFLANMYLHYIGPIIPDQWLIRPEWLITITNLRLFIKKFVMILLPKMFLVFPIKKMSKFSLFAPAFFVVNQKQKINLCLSLPKMMSV